MRSSDRHTWNTSSSVIMPSFNGMVTLLRLIPACSQISHPPDWYRFRMRVTRRSRQTAGSCCSKRGSTWMSSVQFVPACHNQHPSTLHYPRMHHAHVSNSRHACRCNINISVDLCSAYTLSSAANIAVAVLSGSSCFGILYEKKDRKKDQLRCISYSPIQV